MRVYIEASELLRIINRHKAMTLGNLEDINCPDGYRTIVKSGIDYLRSDLVEAVSQSKDGDK